MILEIGLYDNETSYVDCIRIDSDRDTVESIKEDWEDLLEQFDEDFLELEEIKFVDVDISINDSFKRVFGLYVYELLTDEHYKELLDELKFLSNNFNNETMLDFIEWYDNRSTYFWKEN